MAVIEGEMDNKENAHATAKRVMAQEKARVLRREKPKDPRVALLEAAAEAWQKKEECEKILGQVKELVEQRASMSPVEFLQIKPAEHASKDDNRNQETADWIEQRMADWKESNRPKETPKRYLNSASICALSRRIMATEWARALGRKLPDHRALDLEREAKLWEEKRQEKKERAQREREVLSRLCQLLAYEGKFTGADNENWDFCGIEFAVTRAGDGWNIHIEAPEVSSYMNRQGLGGLLGAYNVEVDEDLNIISYSREIPEASIPR